MNLKHVEIYAEKAVPLLFEVRFYVTCFILIKLCLSYALHYHRWHLADTLQDLEFYHSTFQTFQSVYLIDFPDLYLDIVYILSKVHLL